MSPEKDFAVFHPRNWLAQAAQFVSECQRATYISCLHPVTVREGHLHDSLHQPDGCLHLHTLP